MTPPADAGKPGSIPLLTINGQMARMEGKFQITDSIQIECEVGGELSVGGRLVIGERGVVHADVQTVDAIIMGQYEGNMVATGNVEIASSGRVTGNLKTDSLVISKGGFFNGNITKIVAEAKEEPVAKPAETRGVMPLGKKRGGFEDRRPTPQHDDRWNHQQEERRAYTPPEDGRNGRPSHDDKSLSRYTPRQAAPNVESPSIDDEPQLREAE